MESSGHPPTPTAAPSGKATISLRLFLAYQRHNLPPRPTSFRMPQRGLRCSPSSRAHPYTIRPDFRVGVVLAGLCRPVVVREVPALGTDSKELASSAGFIGTISISVFSCLLKVWSGWYLKERHQRSINTSPCPSNIRQPNQAHFPPRGAAEHLGGSVEARDD